MRIRAEVNSFVSHDEPAESPISVGYWLLAIFRIRSALTPDQLYGAGGARYNEKEPILKDDADDLLMDGAKYVLTELSGGRYDGAPYFRWEDVPNQPASAEERDHIEAAAVVLRLTVELHNQLRGRMGQKIPGKKYDFAYANRLTAAGAADFIRECQSKTGGFRWGRDERLRPRNDWTWIACDALDVYKVAATKMENLAEPIVGAPVFMPPAGAQTPIGTATLVVDHSALRSLVIEIISKDPKILDELLSRAGPPRTAAGQPAKE
jgi:hypothetical protein